MSDDRHEYQQEALWRTDAETEQWVASEAAARIAVMLRNHGHEVTMTDAPEGGRHIKARMQDFDLTIRVEAKWTD
jgi:hypothetical protein